MATILLFGTTTAPPKTKQIPASDHPPVPATDSKTPAASAAAPSTLADGATASTATANPNPASAAPLITSAGASAAKDSKTAPATATATATASAAAAASTLFDFNREYHTRDELLPIGDTVPAATQFAVITYAPPPSTYQIV